MAKASQKLGYKVTAPKPVKDSNIGTNNLDMIEILVNDFDFFQDNSWPIFYRDLDNKYPNNRFIFTIRDKDSWIISVVNHFCKKESPMRKYMVLEV